MHTISSRLKLSLKIDLISFNQVVFLTKTFPTLFRVSICFHTYQQQQRTHTKYCEL